MSAAVTSSKARILDGLGQMFGPNRLALASFFVSYVVTMYERGKIDGDDIEAFLAMAQQAVVAEGDRTAQGIVEEISKRVRLATQVRTVHDA